MKIELFSFFCVIFAFSCAQCSNILAIFNAPSKSHAILGVNLAKGLIKRGHHVTLASPFEADSMKNYTYIQLKSILEFRERAAEKILNVTGINRYVMFFHMLSFFKDKSILFWEDPGIQKIIKEKPKYDVVIMLTFFNDGELALAHHLGVPAILFNPIGASSLTNGYVANPNMVYVPNPIITVSTDNFFGRAYTVALNGLMSLISHWIMIPFEEAHPNVKVFISHGGLGGTTETVYHGVPILGIPFFGDQRMNLEGAKLAGYAEVLQIEDLSEATFREKLKEVIGNPKYRQNAKKRSALMKEQPVKPMDNAAFWVEHVIRYGGGSHLRNAGMELTWYQFYMIDIYIFYTSLLGLMLIIDYYLIKLTLRIVRRLFFENNSKLKES